MKTDNLPMQQKHRHSIGGSSTIQKLETKPKRRASINIKPSISNVEDSKTQISSQMFNFLRSLTKLLLI